MEINHSHRIVFKSLPQLDFEKDACELMFHWLSIGQFMSPLSLKSTREPTDKYQKADRNYFFCQLKLKTIVNCYLWLKFV